MNNPSGKILLELLLSPDTPSELFLEYKKQLLLYLTAGEEAVNELNHIDHILSDRPVLDKFNSRVEKIEHCIISSKNGDESAKLLKFETARLNAADNRIAELEKLNDKYRQDTQDNYGDLRGTIKFRKKPIINEAVQWTGDNLREIIDFTGLHPSAQKWTWEEYEEVVKNEGLKIFTLEGPLFASVGDYIMRGVSGEFYPIKPDILAKTYDRVG